MVISDNAYLALLVAVGAERLSELWLSKRNARCAFAEGAFEAGRDHYLLVAPFHAVFLACAAAEVLLLKRRFPGVLGWAALGLTFAAQALRYWCVHTLGQCWNTRIIIWPGRALVTAGPYRFIRHPNYLAVIVEIACVPLIHGAWLTAVVFSAGNAVLLATRIRAEETALGPAYQLAFGQRHRFFP
jgi:methyltransferase